MSTAAQVKTAIDAAITNQTTPASVSQTAVGTQMKNVTDFANDNFVPLELTEDTTINTNGHTAIVTDGTNTVSIGTNCDIHYQDSGSETRILIRNNGNGVNITASDKSNNNQSFVKISNEGVYWQYVDGATGNSSQLQTDVTGTWFKNQLEDKWAFYDKQYHADGSTPGPQEIPDWQFIEGYVDGLFDSGIATLVNGQATVNSALVKTISRQITLNYNSASGTLGILAALGADITDNTSFVIKSLNPDGTVNTADNSQVRYCVIGD